MHSHHILQELPAKETTLERYRMSVERVDSSCSTFDEVLESAMGFPGTQGAAEEPSSGKLGGTEQEKHLVCTKHVYDLTPDATQSSRMVTDTMTMGSAVRVPQALRGATRRTMFDVFGYLNTVTHNSDGEGGSAVPGNAQEEVASQRAHPVCSLGSAARGSASGEEAVSHPSRDLTRSLLHLLPSRCDEKGRGQKSPRQRMQEEVESVSDFDDTDETGSDQPSGPGMLPSEVETEANTVVSGSQQWVFSHDELYRSKLQETVEVPVRKGVEHVTPSASARSRGKGGPPVWEALENADCGEQARCAPGRKSLTTLLGMMETIMHDESRAAASTVSDAKGGKADEGERSTVEALVAEGFDIRFPTTNSSAVPVPPRKRARADTALKRLTDNPTAVIVDVYLTHSSGQWKLGRNAGCSSSEGAVARTSDNVLSDSLAPMNAPSGVQLSFLVQKVENVFSLFILRGTIVWMDDKASEDIRKANSPSRAGRLPEGEPQQQKSDIWSVVLTADIFRASPVVSGEHVYLGRPFFVFASVSTIIASFNVTTDATMRLQGAQCSRGVGLCEDSRANGSVRPSGHGESHALLDTTTPDRTSKLAQTYRGDPSPFWAYDPFVYKVSNWSHKSGSRDVVRVQTENSASPRQGCHPTQRPPAIQSGPGSPAAPSGETASDSTQAYAVWDPMGEGFPRGPGEEWDVSTEVLQFVRCRISSGADIPSLGVSTIAGDGEAARVVVVSQGESQPLTPPPFSQISSLSSFSTPERYGVR
uniref:Uncharacterized protein TCIL3000_10_13580 n=1 Tax=Trypanosoma congolense (strain IL3000) TaxID=1068625 RepID=G0UYV6_TRYCI|nr:unnamed protein product [Trypanosoma congolense IL3000]